MKPLITAQNKTAMEWKENELTYLDRIDPLKLNPNQLRFYNTMVKFASMGVLPSSKQMLFLKRLVTKNKLK